MINDQAMNILLLWCFFLTMNIFVVIMINFQAVNNFVAIVVFSSYDYFCCCIGISMVNGLVINL